MCVCRYFADHRHVGKVTSLDDEMSRPPSKSRPRCPCCVCDDVVVEFIVDDNFGGLKANRGKEEADADDCSR